jgi:hypothetical protein
MTVALVKFKTRLFKWPIDPLLYSTLCIVEDGVAVMRHAKSKVLRWNGTSEAVSKEALLLLLLLLLNVTRSVRHQSTVHDFVGLSPSRSTS